MRKFARFRLDAAHNQTGRIDACGNIDFVHGRDHRELRKRGGVRRQARVLIAFWTEIMIY